MSIASEVQDLHTFTLIYNLLLSVWNIYSSANYYLPPSYRVSQLMSTICVMGWHCYNYCMSRLSY